MNFIYYHSLNPFLFHFEWISVRYYGLFLAFFILLSYFFVYIIWKKNKVDEYFDLYVSIVLFFVMVFARVVHILFYDFEYFYNNPDQIIYFWRGGMASHGGFFGMFFGIFIFLRLPHIRRLKNPFFNYRRVCDTMFPSILAMVFIRFGNFVNGEIVGAITDFPVAVSYSQSSYRLPKEVLPYYREKILKSEDFREKLLKLHSSLQNSGIVADYYNNKGEKIKLDHDELIRLAASDSDLNLLNNHKLLYFLSSLPRHFSQFYESFAALLILIFIAILYNFKNYPPGIIFSLASFLISLSRFIIEFFKEYQTLSPDNFLTMGQYLTIPYVLISLALIVYFYKKSRGQNNVKA